MASSPSAYTLTRASHNDILSIVGVLYKSFDQFARENYFGIATEKDLPRLAEKYTTIMSTDSTDIWIKIEDMTTGSVVAASNWRLCLGSDTAQPRTQDEPVPWLDDQAAEKQRILLEPMNIARSKSNPGPFMYLHILATQPDHRRRGLGAAMMQWGVEVADFLCLPGWIEASPEGNFLYKRFGFYECEEIRRDDELLGRRGEVMGMTMRRDVRKAPLAIIERSG